MGILCHLGAAQNGVELCRVKSATVSVLDTVRNTLLGFLKEGIALQ